MIGQPGTRRTFRKIWAVGDQVDGAQKKRSTMGWETRGNNKYYYRKEREPGGTVRSVYVGAGPVGELAALYDMQERHDKSLERTERQQLIKDLNQHNEVVKEVLELNRSLLAAAMIATGHYQHKRQWRRKA